MDQFPRFDAQPPDQSSPVLSQVERGQWDTVMGYFDGNTVTALWNYAQHFALSDNSFATMSGQSTRGALNLTAGDTYGVLCGPASSVYGDVPECGRPGVVDAHTPAPTNGQLGTFVDDTDPYWDVCSTGQPAALTGRNIGDLLTAAGVTWGWFQGGFTRAADGTCSTESSARSFRPRRRRSIPGPTRSAFRTTCRTTTRSSTSRRRRIRCTCRRRRWPWWAGPTRPSISTISRGSGRRREPGTCPPSRSSRRPPTRTGIPGNSNPLDEQTFLVTTLNRLQQLPEWRDMAVIIAADDSDGWYDHVMPPIVNQSSTPLDFQCGSRSDGPGARCGYGPRLPLLVISPYAKAELRQPRADRPDVHPAVHRGQLAGRRAHQHHLVRPDRGIARRHVRLLAARHAALAAGSRHRSSLASGGLALPLTRSIGSVVHTSVGRCWRRTP